jgi:hypothetical protein
MNGLGMRRFSFFLFLAAMLLAPAARAEDLKLEARLIWGTNDEKSPDPSHKKVDEKTAKELMGIFKWKNYFEVCRLTTNVVSRGSVKLEMSKMCQIEIKELPGPQVEVSLIGKGNKVTRTNKALSKGNYLTVGGADKNDTAWFVVITQL